MSKSKDKRTGWLKELKVGDKVIIRYTHGESITKILKITPTGRITTKYRTFDYIGKETSGSRWNKSRLSEWSQEKENELVKKIEFKSMCCKIQDLHFQMFWTVRVIITIF